MKRILLSLIAFTGVWMTAGAQTETEYVKKTKETNFNLYRAELNHISSNKFVYKHDVDVDGTTIQTTFTLSNLNRKNIAYLSKDDEKCLDLNKGTDFKFTWDDTNSSIYSVGKVTSFTVSSAAYEGFGIPIIDPKNEIYVSLNKENKVKISSLNTSKDNDDAFVPVTTVANFENGTTGIDVTYSGFGRFNQYINIISCNYQIEYYVLNFANANTVYGQAEALYGGLKGASLNSDEAGILKAAIDEMASFKNTYENKAVATNNGLHTQLAGKVVALQTAIDAFKCTLNEAGAYEAADKTFTSVKVERKMKANGIWNTLCLPFNAPVPDGWTVKELKSVTYESGTYDLKFQQVATIEAGKPYIAKVGSDIDDYTFEFPGGVTLVANTTPVVVTAENGGKASFTGSYVIIGIAKDDNNYVIDNANKFHLVDIDNVKIKGFRGYFHIDESGVTGATGNALYASFDDDTTGITTVNVNADGDDSYYNVAGQRVNGNTKGIIIKNGKKYFVK